MRMIYVFNQGVNKRALMITINQSWEVRFPQLSFVDVFDIDMLMQHKFYCVHRTRRSLVEVGEREKQHVIFCTIF